MSLKPAAAAALAAVLFLGNAGMANAQTTADLQAQINALLAQIAALQGSTSTSVAGSAFTMDMTLGSSGSEVTRLQSWLISKGFSIPAGATGYFGAQTKAALGAYQASVGISPAAGYFGPVTRSNVNASVSTGAGTGTNTGNTGNGSGTSSNSGALKGGEADLSDFDLKREDVSGHEGEGKVPVATATFDVDGGDIRIERLEILASAQNSALGSQPWKYFDSVSVLADGKAIASEDVDNRKDWNEVRKGVYRLSLTSLKHIVRDGNAAELTLAFDISDSIDSSDLNQKFAFSIENRGIRAVDAAGIQQYIGNGNDTVTFGFDAMENGDLTIRSSNDDPRSSVLIADEKRESGDYSVFAFDIKNDDEADTVINELALDVTNLGSGIDADEVLRQAVLRADGDRFIGDIGTSTITFEDMDLEIDGKDTITFELEVRLVRNAPATAIGFSVSSPALDAEGVASGDTSEVSGSARSATHQVVLSGIVASNGKTTSEARVRTTSSEKGEYALTFDVEALEETVYINRSADTATSTVTSGVAYSIHRGNEAVELAPEEVTDFLQAARSDNADTSEYFIVREGTKRTFTLLVTINPTVSGYYSVGLEAIRFDDARDGVADDSTYLVPEAKEFETDAVQLSA